MKQKDNAELKSWLASRTRKLVPSPTKPGGRVRVLKVTRDGWEFRCPERGRQSLAFSDTPAICGWEYFFRSMQEIIDELNPSNEVLNRWLRQRGVLVPVGMERREASVMMPNARTYEKIQGMIEDESKVAYATGQQYA